MQILLLTNLIFGITKTNEWRILMALLQLGISKFTSNLEAIQHSNNKLKLWSSPHQELEVIDARVFGIDNIENLGILSLSNYNLKKIEPHAFDNLINVRFIDLHMNNLTSLPSDLFSKTTKLKALDLSQNNFLPDSLPNHLLQRNIRLVNFTMIHNKQAIKTLPNGFFSNMIGLKNLRLTDIGLYKVHQDLLWGSNEIEELYLDNNGLRDIPLKFLRDCENLKKLILKYNEIDHLQRDIFSTLMSLEILDLSYNKINYIDNYLLNGLFSLHTIKMDHNHLTRIDPEAFRNQQSLQIAHFSFNNLTFKQSEIISVDKDESLSPLLFCQNTLEELHVDHNIITDVFSDWISAPHLRILNLAHNKISYLHISELQFLSNVIEVDLSHNEIHSVDLQGIEILSPENYGKVTINVQDNPIRCDHKLNSLLKFINKNIHSYSQDDEDFFNLKVDDLKCYEHESVNYVKTSYINIQSQRCEMIESSNDNLPCPQNCKCMRSLSDKSILFDCSYRAPITAPELRVDVNPSKIIDAQFFADKENLVMLNLSNKNLTEIKPHTFDKLKYARFIDLHMNNLISLPSDLFSKTTKLKALDLSHNNFLPDSLPNHLLQRNILLVNFTMIHNKQSIDILPDRFLSNLMYLKHIKLTDNGLNIVPEDLIWNSKNIETIYMDKNNLGIIRNHFFRDCRKLKKLILAYNSIDRLSDNIFSTLTSLEILDLSYNNIKYISNHLLNGLSSLRTIKIEHNQLKKIDSEAFRSLQNLQVAHFSFNRLSLKLSELIDIDGTLMSLERANANENTSHSVFHYCQNTLKELHVDHNIITDVFSDWISAPHLRILNLAHNKISYLHISDLQFVSNIIEVNMSHNEIHSVDLQGVEMMSSKNYAKVIIDVEDNPMRCDCKLNSLLKFIKGNVYPHVQDNSGVFNLKVDNLKCHEPESLRGVRINDLRTQSLICKM